VALVAKGCLILQVALSLSLSACLPGGGTEDANDLQVSGRLVDGKGRPSAGALVILHPKSVQTAAAPTRKTDAGLKFGTRVRMPEPESTLTDREGFFVFRHVVPGGYSLQGMLRSGSEMVFLPSLDVSTDAVHLPPLVLEPVASLRGSLAGSTWIGGRALLAGTPFQAAVDSAGRFDFPDLAPGRFELRVHASGAEGVEREVSRRLVALEAGQSLELSPVSTELALGWAHRVRLDLETPVPGEGVVTDFPLLVRLAGEDFPRDAQAGGRDIRFARPDGSPLPHEIERWDSLSGRAEIWVRMDTVRTDSGQPALWMYWGNPSAEDASAGAAVHDSAGGSAGVWHLHQDPSGSPPQMMDASVALNHGTFQGSGSRTSIEAAVGLGVAFDGIDQYVSTANVQSDPDVFTLSLWFRAAGEGKLAGFESGATGPSRYFDRHLWLDSAGHLHFGIFTPVPAVLAPADSPYVRTGMNLPGEDPARPYIQRILVSPDTYLDGNWHQVAAVLSPQGQSLYVDGVLAAADARVTDGAAYQGYWRFGGGSLGDWVGRSNREYFQGQIDQASVALRARSAAWIRLAFLTEAPGATRLRINIEY
jgi:hypothetical protein